MAKFYLKTGVMGCGKSLDLIRSVYSYRERGMKVLVYNPAINTRNKSEKCLILSRTGASVEAEWVSESDNIFQKVQQELKENPDIKAVFLDEIQLYTIAQIEQLSDIVTILNIPVLAYGIKVDFQGHLFPAIIRVFELCDDIQELRSVCWCGKRANQNARIHNGQVIKSGEQIMIGGSDSYISLCNKHFKENNLGNKYLN